MRSEVRKGHRHNHRQHSQHHRKRKRQENLPDNSCGEVSSVPLGSPDSENFFPLAKERTVSISTGSRGTRSGRNGEYKNGNHNSIDNGEPVVISSDSEDSDAHQSLLAAKRKKKQNHREKKLRYHSNKREQEEQNGGNEKHFTVKVKQEPLPSDTERSPVQQVREFRTVRLKQEPIDSDEENSTKPRVSNQKPQRSSHEGRRNTHSHRHLGESNGRQHSPQRVVVKEEPRDDGAPRRRKPPTDNRRGERSRNSRKRRDGRAEEPSVETDNGRVQRSQSRERDERRNCNGERRSGEREGPRRREWKRERRSDDEGQYEWGRAETSRPQATDTAAERPAEKHKPNFGLSGKLTEDTNTFNGIVIKYSEPPEARKPKRRWRFYPFKGDQGLPTLYLHRQSAYLIGRDRKVADIPIDHPSCSKQHAALQYRLVPFTREDGTKGKRVRPYIIDLDSANGTFVNNQRIDPRKYVELMERDVVKFGYSSRDYVLLHEQSKDDVEDDDNV